MTTAAAIVADLTPAPFDPNARAHAHAAWTWTVQMHALNATWSLRQLTDGQLRDVELAAEVFGALIGAERGRRRAAAEESKAPAYRVARCGQTSIHAPHVVDWGPDQPRNCPGYRLADVGTS